MSRETFIRIFDSEFIKLVTDEVLQIYDLGYTGGLLRIALDSNIITLHEYTFLSEARLVVL